MENYNEIDVKGQVVFVEPLWVTGETCLTNIENPIQYAIAKSKLTKIRKDFISRLEREGFIITYDESDIKDDTVCLIMNTTNICDNNTAMNIYKKEYDKVIFNAGGEKLNYPLSLTVEEYFNNPFFPAVLKNELMNAGIDKFLIETPEQLEIIKKFYRDFSSDKNYKEAFDCSIFQQLIETPTKYKTYMRVLMSSSGDVMGASLKYSNAEEQKAEPKGIFEQHFWNEKSEYFLNSKKMFNYYSGGGNIYFPQPRYSDEKKDILAAHGIDPNCPTIPNDILEVSSSIAQKLNRELGIMCGIDFILNEKDKKWYYLEIQAFPAIEEWAMPRNIRTIKVKSIDDYIKYLTLELETRYDALMMHMVKKLSTKQNNEIDINKSYKLKIK